MRPFMSWLGVVILGGVLLTGCNATLGDMMGGWGSSSSETVSVTALVKQVSLTASKAEAASTTQPTAKGILKIEDIASNQKDGIIEQGGTVQVRLAQTSSSDLYRKRVQGKLRIQETQSDTQEYYLDNIEVQSAAPQRDDSSRSEHVPSSLVRNNGSLIAAQVNGYTVSDGDLLGFREGVTVRSLDIDVATAEPVTPAAQPAVQAGDQVTVYSVNEISSDVFGKTIKATVRKGVSNNQRFVTWVQDVSIIK